MATTRVRLNHAWFAAFLKSDKARQIVRPAAERVLAEAQATAPVKTGAYRDSLHIIDGTTDRAVEGIGSDLPYALSVEARDSTLRRALDAM
jgi:hypothetical protein